MPIQFHFEKKKIYRHPASPVVLLVFIQSMISFLANERRRPFAFFFPLCFQCKGESNMTCHKSIVNSRREITGLSEK